jgi:7-cyano-7-deazaguanine reductase
MWEDELRPGRLPAEPFFPASLAMPSPLETFPNPYPDRTYEIEISCPEFTSVCPKTGQPDFGTIVIRYVAGRTCVELKSVKLYLQEYRNRGIFYESAVNAILDDLVAACAPRSMTVVGQFTPRGGISSRITASFGRTMEETGRAPGTAP